MFCVTVTFEVKQECIAEFRKAMHAQAHNSLTREPGCLQFDVCFSPGDQSKVFLYEVYINADAFQDHLETEHFREFDDAVRDMFISKVAEQWERLEEETSL